MTPEQLQELRQYYLDWISSNPSNPYELEENFTNWVKLVEVIRLICINKPQ